MRSPQEVVREAATGHGLTWAQARSADRLMSGALRWSHQYEGMNISASSGPVIRAWPFCHRVHVYGGERFVLGRDFVPAVNAWHTYGPIDPSRLIRSERRYIEFNRPAVRPQPAGWPAQAVRTGAVISCFENAITFKRDQTVKRLRLVQSTWTRAWPLIFVLGRGDRHETVNLADQPQGLRRRLEPGDWFGIYSTNVSNSLLVINRGEPVVLIAQAGRQSALARIETALRDEPVRAGQTRHYALLGISDPLDIDRRRPDRFLQIADDLADPDGLKILRGTRHPSIGLIRVAAQEGAVEVQMPRSRRRRGMPVPICITGLNPRWSAGMLRIQGHSMGYYTDGNKVYMPLGFDLEGLACLSLFPDQADETHVRAGHPAVCDCPDLFIEAVPRPVQPGMLRWHVAANNPTDHPVTAEFRQALDVPDLDFEHQTRTIRPGQYLVLLD